MRVGSVRLVMDAPAGAMSLMLHLISVEIALQLCSFTSQRSLIPCLGRGKFDDC